MPEESSESRKSSFPLVAGLLLVILSVFVAFGVWGVREVYFKVKDSEKVGLIAHTWIYSDPQIAGELGTLMTTTAITDAPEEFKSHRTAHVRFHVMGSKSAGDVEVWMMQYPGTSWTVTGAVLTTADKRRTSVGSPPNPVDVAGKRD